ncbi:MAG: class I SAM-dependent methyltransferase [Chthoniobacteraceae bacterium]
MQFDRIAAYYHWMELFCAGGLMQRSRLAHLAGTKDCRSALLVGEGHGRFLEALLRYHPTIEVTFLDSSAQMIAHTRARLERRGLDLSRVTFIHADLLQSELPGRTFDLIVTHFFLDCLQPAQLRRAVRMLGRSAAPEAIWLLADFQIPPAGWRRWRARVIVFALYTFFRWTARLSARWLTPPDSFLGAAGFQLHKRRASYCGLAHSDLWRRGVPG